MYGTGSSGVETEKPRRQHCHDTEGVGRDQHCQKLEEEPPPPPARIQIAKEGTLPRLRAVVCDVSTCHSH